MRGPAVEHVAVAAALDHRDVAVDVRRGVARGLGVAHQREERLERELLPAERDAEAHGAERARRGAPRG